MSRRTGHTTRCDDFLQCFLCAGGTAFLLSLTHVNPEFWFVSAFALVPFLWRVLRTNLSGTAGLGVILAGSYAFVTCAGEMPTAPVDVFFKFARLAAVFSGFGIAVNLLNGRIGFNPIFAAALWLPLEYFLGITGSSGVFDITASDPSLLVRMASLFGALMISFVIVLINALVLILLDWALMAGPGHDYCSIAGQTGGFLAFVDLAPLRIWYLLPQTRAPPTP